MSTDIHRNRHWSGSAAYVLSSMQGIGKKFNTVRWKKIGWHNCHRNWIKTRQWNDGYMRLCGNLKGNIFHLVEFATPMFDLTLIVVVHRNEMLMLNIDFPINRVREVKKNQPDVAWYFVRKLHMMMEQLNRCKFVRSKLFAVRMKTKKKIFLFGRSNF